MADPAAPTAAAPSTPAAAPASAAAPGATATATAPAATDPAAAAPAAVDTLLGAAPAADPAKPAEKPAAAAEPAAADVAKFLGEKGVKPEELAKMDAAAQRAKFDELKAADAKAAATAGIELKMPEGFEIDDKTLTDLKGILADANLSPSDRGQKLVDMHAAVLKQALEEPAKQWTAMQEKWRGEVATDPEIGGANQPQALASIAKAIDSLGGKEAKEIREAFNFTGAGNNPQIVRLLYRMSVKLNEGGIVPGGAPAPGGGFQKAVQGMYPSATGTNSP